MNRAEADKMLYNEIKPFIIVYFNVKAKLLCDTSQYEEMIELLTVTINLILLDEESLETCKIF